jgi:hypothetical protein
MKTKIGLIALLIAALVLGAQAFAYDDSPYSTCHREGDVIVYLECKLSEQIAINHNVVEAYQKQNAEYLNYTNWVKENMIPRINSGCGSSRSSTVYVETTVYVQDPNKDDTLECYRKHMSGYKCKGEEDHENIR